MNGEIKLSSGNLNTGLPEQMSGDWIDYVIAQIGMDINATAADKSTANRLFDYLENEGKISKFVTAVDKSNGPANNLGRNFRLNIVNYGKHSKP